MPVVTEHTVDLQDLCFVTDTTFILPHLLSRFLGLFCNIVTVRTDDIESNFYSSAMMAMMAIVTVMKHLRAKLYQVMSAINTKISS